MTTSVFVIFFLFLLIPFRKIVTFRWKKIHGAFIFANIEQNREIRENYFLVKKKCSTVLVMSAICLSIICIMGLKIESNAAFSEVTLRIKSKNLQNLYEQVTRLGGYSNNITSVQFCHFRNKIHLGQNNLFVTVD